MLWMLVDTGLIVVAGLVSIPWLRDAIEVSRTRVTEMPPNSNESAVQEYLGLLDEAQTEIVMYDDGDTTEGSLYQSRAVVDAIQAKIEENPTFKVKCVLNNQRGETLFERELENLAPQVNIRGRRENPTRVHYKIIDRRKAYVSRHPSGESARTRKMIDCSRSPSRRTGQPPLALRRYFDDFERHAA